MLLPLLLMWAVHPTVSASFPSCLGSFLSSWVYDSGHSSISLLSSYLQLTHECQTSLTRFHFTCQTLLTQWALLLSPPHWRPFCYWPLRDKDFTAWHEMWCRGLVAKCFCWCQGLLRCKLLQFRTWQVFPPKYFSKTVFICRLKLPVQIVINTRRASLLQTLRRGGTLRGGMADGTPSDWLRQTTWSAEGQGSPCHVARLFTLCLAIDMINIRLILH